MFAAGITRAKIDWLWGMNLTRLYTKHLGAICSISENALALSPRVGCANYLRDLDVIHKPCKPFKNSVQTAVVNMIASRDNEIEHFTKKPYFKLRLDNGAGFFCEGGG